MSEAQKEKIERYIKNGLDISDLIRDYDIKGMYLAGAIIKDFNRVQDSLQNTNFANCVIGEADKITNLSGTNFRGCNFQRVTFVGKTWLRACDLRDCNFAYADLSKVEYQYADLRNIIACETILRIGSKVGLHARFEWKLFEDFAKYTNVEVIK